MRFVPSLLLGLGLGLAVVPQVSGLTECYPSCSTFTAAFSGSAIDEKTPWSGQIGLNKFDTQSGTRTLTGVNIKTIVYFNTSVYVTRTTSASDFAGNIVPGVMLHMDLSSNAGLLGQYWGRWGNYAERSQNGQDVTGIADSSTWAANAPPLFVDYTYPFFDVIGAVACGGGGAVTCASGASALPLPLGPGQSPQVDPSLHTGPVWAYYVPSANTGTLGWPQYWYGPTSRGMYVERIDDLDQPTDVNTNPISQYFQQSLEPTLDNEQTLTFDNSFPLNVEQQVGTTQTFDRFTDTSQAFSKSILASDANGGQNKDILPQTMLNLFTGTGQIQFDAAATGQYRATFTGGNAGVRQQTYAKVAMRVEYTYNQAVTGDPQFGGFQGQSFQVHGYPGSYFNLFSAPSFQMNGRFTYLATGHCKYSHTPCWTHPGTYIDDIAFVVDELLIRVIAGPVGAGYTVLINNEPFHGDKYANDSDSKSATHGDAREFVPTKFYDPKTKLTIHLKSPLEVVVRTDLVAFGIHNADHFFNIDSQLLVRPIMQMGRKASADYPDPVTGKPGFPSYPIHGFIGQTWANKVYPNNRQYQGEPDDYVETRPYSTESLFSQYNKEFDDQQLSTWDN